MAVQRHRPQSLKEIFIAISRVECAYSYFSGSIAALSEESGTLFRRELTKGCMKTGASSQFSRGLFCPVRFAGSRRPVQNDLAFALKNSLNTTGYAFQGRKRNVLRWRANYRLISGRR